MRYNSYSKTEEDGWIILDSLTITDMSGFAQNSAFLINHLEMDITRNTSGSDLMCKSRLSDLGEMFSRLAIENKPNKD